MTIDIEVTAQYAGLRSRTRAFIFDYMLILAYIALLGSATMAVIGVRVAGDEVGSILGPHSFEIGFTVCLVFRPRKGVIRPSAESGT